MATVPLRSNLRRSELASKRRNRTSPLSLGEFLVQAMPVLREREIASVADSGAGHPALRRAAEVRVANVRAADFEAAVTVQFFHSPFGSNRSSIFNFRATSSNF